MVRKFDKTLTTKSFIPELGKLSQHVKAEDRTGCHTRSFRITGEIRVHTWTLCWLKKTQPLSLPFLGLLTAKLLTLTQ